MDGGEVTARRRPEDWGGRERNQSTDAAIQHAAAGGRREIRRGRDRVIAGDSLGQEPARRVSGSRSGDWGSGRRRKGVLPGATEGGVAGAGGGQLRGAAEDFAGWPVVGGGGGGGEERRIRLGRIGGASAWKRSRLHTWTARMGGRDHPGLRASIVLGLGRARSNLAGLPLPFANRANNRKMLQPSRLISRKNRTPLAVTLLHAV